jgi:hypothetical protein
MIALTRNRDVKRSMGERHEGDEVMKGAGKKRCLHFFS